MTPLQTCYQNISDGVSAEFCFTLNVKTLFVALDSETVKHLTASKMYLMTAF